MDLLKLIKNVDTGHSRRVSLISGLMARKLGCSQKESKIIEQATLFHDVGKSAIPQCILDKPSALTTGEFEIIKTHTTAGVEQLTAAVRVLSLAAVIANQHHEHINGKGYHHLQGNEIHPFARLVACADVFDALYSRRSYKEPWSIDKITEFFDEKSGTQFDITMVELLLDIIDEVLAIY